MVILQRFRATSRISPPSESPSVIQSVMRGAFAALAVCGLVACGDAPSEADIRGALGAQVAALVGESATSKSEINKIKLVGCRDADGGQRCDWTGPMGGGSGRFVKKDGAWILVGN